MPTVSERTTTGWKIEATSSSKKGTRSKGAFPIPAFSASLFTLSTFDIPGTSRKAIKVVSVPDLPSNSDTSWTLFHASYAGARPAGLVFDSRTVTNPFAEVYPDALPSSTHVFYLEGTTGGKSTRFTEQSISTPSDAIIDAVTSLQGMLGDGVLSRLEKPSFKVIYQNAISVKDYLITEGQIYGTLTQAQVTAYSNAVNAIVICVTTLNPAWNDTTKYTAIDRANLKNLFSNVSTTEASLRQKLQEIVSGKLDDAISQDTLTSTKKRAISAELGTVLDKQGVLTAQAAVYSVSTANLSTSVNGLLTFLGTISGWNSSTKTWNDFSSVRLSAGSGKTLADKFNDCHLQIINLQNAIVTAAKDKAVTDANSNTSAVVATALAQAQADATTKAAQAKADALAQMNLDLKGVVSGSTSAADAVAKLQALAQQASTNASSAISTASSASTNASTALANANSATTTANAANTSATNAVSSANSASTNASNAVSAANTATSTANTASTNASNAVNTANAANTNVTNIQTGVIPVGGNNLSMNGSFEKVEGWGIYNNGGNDGVTFVYDSVASAYGTKSALVSFPNGATGTIGITRSAANRNNWSDSRYYIVSVYACGGGSAVGKTLELEWNNAPSSVVALQNPVLTSKFQRYVFKIKWNTGATVEGSGRIYISIATGQLPLASGTLRFDGFQVEEGEVPTAFNPSVWDAFDDAATAQASASNAQTSANNAQTTANTANTNAATAQTSANNAQTTATSAVNRVTSFSSPGALPALPNALYPANYGPVITQTDWSLWMVNSAGTAWNRVMFAQTGIFGKIYGDNIDVTDTLRAGVVTAAYVKTAFLQVSNTIQTSSLYLDSLTSNNYITASSANSYNGSGFRISGNVFNATICKGIGADRVPRYVTMPVCGELGGDVSCSGVALGDASTRAIAGLWSYDYYAGYDPANTSVKRTVFYCGSSRNIPVIDDCVLTLQDYHLIEDINSRRHYHIDFNLTLPWRDAHNGDAMRTAKVRILSKNLLPWRTRYTAIDRYWYFPVTDRIYPDWSGVTTAANTVSMSFDLFQTADTNGLDFWDFSDANKPCMWIEVTLINAFGSGMCGYFKVDRTNPIVLNNVGMTAFT